MKRIILMMVFATAYYFGTAQKIQKVKIEALSDYIKKADHPVVVNFWATWCAPCTHELVYFESNIKKYKEQKVELILVSLDFPNDYPNKVTEFLNKNRYGGTFFWLDETNADHFCPMVDSTWSGAIPSTLFLNPKTGHRSFFDRQVTEPQLLIELKNLVGAK